MQPAAIIVDTSVIVKWLNQTNEDYIEQADKIIKAAELEIITILAPELAKYEAGNVLIGAKGLSVKQASDVLGQLYKLPITFVEDTLELAKETLRLASKAKITYYDASFMALALKYDAVLVTDNAKHQARLAEVKVKALKDY
ncbi:MAG TPA: type II toxin-antitoxin system VapC family toxin [Candidatus Binatia bacterium]|nr:type II toxin-antitoxin system VapC family toxin [Candidatus Binatia bacterium]